MLLLTETWLYSHSDEAHIAAMTPAGYEFRSLRRRGSRGGAASVSSRGRSCQLVHHSDLLITDLWKQWRCRFHWIMSQLFLCLYRRPLGKGNDLNNSVFLEEFTEFLSQYADSRRDIVYPDDFNFHYDDSSDGQVSRLKTLLSGHSLSSSTFPPTSAAISGLGCSPHREHLSEL